MRVVIFIMVLLVGVVVVRRSRVAKRPTASANSCINNLRQLDGAMEQWMLETKATNGQPADVTAVLQYVKGGAMPVCEQGGTYALQPAGLPPTCTFAGHKL